MASSERTGESKGTGMPKERDQSQLCSVGSKRTVIPLYQIYSSVW